MIYLSRWITDDFSGLVPSPDDWTAPTDQPTNNEGLITMRMPESTPRRGSGSPVTLKRLSRKARNLEGSPTPTTERGKRRAARREAALEAASAAALAAHLEADVEGANVS